MALGLAGFLLGCSGSGQAPSLPNKETGKAIREAMKAERKEEARERAGNKDGSMRGMMKGRGPR